MLGFVPDELKEDADTLILFQNPGDSEEDEGKPVVGKTGQMLDAKFYPRAGRTRDQLSLANTLRCRLLVPDRRGKRLVEGATHKAVNTLPPLKVLHAAVRHCMSAHFRVPEATKLIVAQGAVAWRALGCPGSITDFRGYLSPNAYDASC